MKRKELAKASETNAALELVNRILKADHLILQTKDSNGALQLKPAGKDATKLDHDEAGVYAAIKDQLDVLRVQYESALVFMGVEL